MSSLVKLETFRAQLKLADDETSEDAYFQQLLDAAESTASVYLDRPLDDPNLTPAQLLVIGQAVIVITAAWESDREGRDDLPRAAIALLRPIRNLAR